MGMPQSAGCCAACRYGPSVVGPSTHSPTPPSQAAKPPKPIPINFLDPGCPSFLGAMSHKFVGYTPNKGRTSRVGFRTCATTSLQAASFVSKTFWKMRLLEDPCNEPWLSSPLFSKFACPVLVLWRTGFGTGQPEP